MKRTNIFATLACALLVSSLLGCGATNKFESITLSVSQINGATTAASGVVNLQGAGSTMQLQAIGNYSSSKTADLTNKVTYTVIVDPEHPWADMSGTVQLLPPCQAPTCPIGTAPNYTSGTVEYSNSGLITAVEPAECTWTNSAVDPATTPAWSWFGGYIVTASYEGVTSQPIYVPVGSAAGVYDQYSNPSGQCGPTP
ncbi:MAG: hypothetical protein WCC04_03315 [Terriglobales bacterium]